MLGTTFSEFRIQQLGYPVADALTELLDFRFDIVRIGTYWNEIEKVEHIYDISSVQYIVDQCQKNGQKILMCIGAKSPRWPEFHIPKWAAAQIPRSFPIPSIYRNPLNSLSDQILRYVEKMVSLFRQYDCIQAWQIENEPLDPSGPDNWTIPIELLRREIELVKSIDTKPVIVSIWGNTLIQRKLLHKIDQLTDVIGLDLYYKVPDSTGYFYSAPNNSDAEIHNQLHSLSKPTIITELQAEPWENRKLNYTPSMSPTILVNNVRRAVEHIRADSILLWGFEYWYARKHLGDMTYYDAVHMLKQLYAAPSKILT